MKLTARERELLSLIQEAPLATPEELARRLGTTRASVNVHVSNLVRKGAILGRGYILPERVESPRVVVVGGANIDLKVRTLAPAIPATSNPGFTSQAPGGVGRNVAEHLARLGVATTLISAVGQDDLGDALLRDTAEAGVDVHQVLRVPGASTGTYTAVLDATGDLLVAVAAMQVIDALDVTSLRRRRAAFHGAGWVVADGNLTAATLVEVLDLAADAGARVVFEPVSVPKAAHLLVALDAGHVPYAVTPNIDELAVLAGTAVPDTKRAIRRAALDLHERGIELVWVRRGVKGSLLSLREEMHSLDALAANVVDVTGAGDAMLGAFLAGLVHGYTPEQAARLGHAAAALTVASTATVVPDLTLEALETRLHPRKDTSA
jgi:pseudouridine kinase